MEQIRLPLSSLQFLAGHAVVRRLVLMKVDMAYWYTHSKNSLRECELRVDKLPLPPAPREYVKNVLKRFFEHVKKWVSEHHEKEGADILLDAHENVDERNMARHHFQKRYKGEFYREDFQCFAGFLEHLSWYDPWFCSDDFVSLIVNLQKVNTSLKGPEYRLVDGDLYVEFRFVNRRRVTRRSVPPEFNTLLEFDAYPLVISKEQNDILVTYDVHDPYYNEDMLRIYVDLLQPPQRLEFIKDVLDENWEEGERVFSFVNYLDPETRWNCLLCLNEDRFQFTAYNFLECCLFPGYELLFIPMMRLVGLNLAMRHYLSLFESLINNIRLIGFDHLLLQFWQLLPASGKDEFHNALGDDDDEYHYDVKEAMRKLSKTNTELFQVMFDYVSASLSKEQACNLRCVILNE